MRAIARLCETKTLPVAIDLVCDVTDEWLDHWQQCPAGKDAFDDLQRRLDIVTGI